LNVNIALGPVNGLRSSSDGTGQPLPRFA
jgi:hypothetical protein